MMEHAESDPGWEQVTLIYYAGDGVLVDDKEEPINDVERMLGKGFGLGSFGGASNDANLCYVRNPKLEVDFEICLDKGSYVDVVLNYGRPNPP